MKLFLSFFILSLTGFWSASGQTWSQAGPGFNGVIMKLTIDAGGNVYAAGSFTNTSGGYYVARWNGSNWIQVGTTFNNIIQTLTTDAAGNVYAAGNFTNASGRYVAKWDGISWSQVGTTGFNNSIQALATDAAGNIYAAGSFTNGLGNCYVARWNGSNWSQAGVNFSSYLVALATDEVGNVYAAGNFTNASGRYVAKWDGISWSQVGTTGFNNTIQALTTDAAGDVYAAGNFTNASGRYVARWDGVSWSQVGTTGFNNTIQSLATNVAGNIYAGGWFTTGAGNFFFIAQLNTSGLPVELRSFTASQKGDCSMELLWSTSVEANFRDFNIEISVNGSDFHKVETIAAKGSQSTYSYIYNGNSEQRFYFRLKMVDIDEKYKYSNIEAIWNKCTAKRNIRLYPTFTKNGDITIDGTQSSDMITMYSIGGQLVYRSKAKDGLNMLHLPYLVAGNYVIRIQTESGEGFIYKIIKD